MKQSTHESAAPQQAAKSKREWIAPVVERHDVLREVNAKGGALFDGGSRNPKTS